jgi:hypothetical protein
MVIAIAAYCQGVQIEAFTNSSGTVDFQLGAWSGIVTVLWLVGLTNLLDLTRRIEGLTAGIGLVLLGYRAATGFGSGAEFPALFSIGLAGALIGILVYNLPPTRIRLGGGGAGFVGFLVASLTTIHSSHESTLSASVFVAVIILRRAGEYAFVRPGREMLWSPLDKETTYKAKNTVDVPVYRGADYVIAQGQNAISAAGMSASSIMLIGAGVAGLWALVGWWLGKRFESGAGAERSNASVAEAST